MTEDPVQFDVAAVERTLGRPSEPVVDDALGQGHRFPGAGEMLEVFPGTVRVLVTFQNGRNVARNSGWSDYTDPTGKLLSMHAGGEVVYIPNSPVPFDQVTASVHPVTVDADIAQATIPITLIGNQPTPDYRPGGWIDFETTGQRLSMHKSGVVLLINKPRKGSGRDKRTTPGAREPQSGRKSPGTKKR